MRINLVMSNSKSKGKEAHVGYMILSEKDWEEFLESLSQKGIQSTPANGTKTGTE